MVCLCFFQRHKILPNNYTILYKTQLCNLIFTIFLFTYLPSMNDQVILAFIDSLHEVHKKYGLVGTTSTMSFSSPSSPSKLRSRSSSPSKLRSRSSSPILNALCRSRSNPRNPRELANTSMYDMYVNVPTIEECLANVVYDKSDLFDGWCGAVAVTMEDTSVALFCKHYSASKHKECEWVEIPHEQDAVMSIKCVGDDRTSQDFTLSIGGAVQHKLQKPWLTLVCFHSVMSVLIPPNTRYIEVVSAYLSSDLRSLAMSRQARHLSAIKLMSNPLGDIDQQFSLLELGVTP